MPKIKDLGIKVVPQTRRVAGRGGGGCGDTNALPCGEFTEPGCGTHTITALCGPTYCLLCMVMTPVGCGVHTGNMCHFSPLGRQKQGLFTQEQIAALKEAMQEQIAALDELARSAGPATVKRRKGPAKKKK